MKLFKAAMLSATLVSAVSVAAYAADPVSSAPANPPQIATNPSLPYSYARTPGPKTGPSTWIPSTSSTSQPTTTPNTAGEGGYYSGKGFGPKPN
jgi:hypothetical protein